jgi:hypothetical protein
MSTPTTELLDEARRELRALLDDLRAGCGGPALLPAPRPLIRLCALLGLSERERAFVSVLADDAADFDLYNVLADWLEDEGRTKDGARVRRLVPQDGDVLIWRMPPTDTGGVLLPFGAYEAAARNLQSVLMGRGVNTAYAVLPDDANLSALDPDRMRAAGWVRDGSPEMLARMREVSDWHCVCQFGGEPRRLLAQCDFHRRLLERAVAAERQRCAALADRHRLTPEDA